MKTEQIAPFIETLLNALENEIIQQPSMTHVIHSLQELKALYQKKEHWLQRILSRRLQYEDMRELKQLGNTLKNAYQVSLYDVFKIIDRVQDYLFSNLGKLVTKEEKKYIHDDIKAIKSSLAHGYFEASLEEFIKHLDNGFIGPSQAMIMHKRWLLQLEKHFLDLSGVPLPEMEHNQCEFSQWLSSMASQLALYASGNKAFDLRGNILLAHRGLHEQGYYVHNYLKQKSYFEALTHFEAMIREFLLLDKYISEAHFNYLSNPYRYFIEFVSCQTKSQNRIDYYLVIHFGLLKQSDIYYKRKKEILDCFSELFQQKLKEDKIDFISLEYNESLHVVVNEESVRNYDRISTVDQILKQVKSLYNQSLTEQLRVKFFELGALPLCDSHHFESILQKMAQDECDDAICTIGSEQFLYYRDEVAKDVELLKIIENHLNQKNFEMHYQPIVDKYGHCMTVEALLRMSVNEQPMAAEQFLNLVENHKLTLEIDQLVFELLKKDIPRLKSVAPMLNVNIYPQSLGQLAFIRQAIELSKICRKNQIQLVIEITEHEALLHNNVLQELHEKHHILFAIDDFGTGYSNLAKLAELAGKHIVQQAKLDGSLIEGIHTDEAKLRVVRFITDMAANLGLQPVIAEFVDSKEKLNALKKLPSQILYQGYFFSHVLTLEQLCERFAAGKPLSTN
jgi:EAL domain-containing protein (putative c-di-GMP-specific phosphodiesterase class I)